MAQPILQEKVPIATLQDILQSDRLHRERRHLEWTDNYLLYRLRVITNRLTQRQSMNVPYVKETIRTLLARTGTAPDVYFEDLANNKDRELLMNETWLEAFIRLKLRILDIVDKKQEGLYGRSFMKGGIVGGKIWFGVLDPQDVLLDRFMNPWDISTARHVTHVGIYRTLSDVERNPLYDQDAVKQLKIFFATKQGLIKASENAMIVADRNQRLRDMGVPDVENLRVGETYVEINETQIKVFDEQQEEDIVYVVPTADAWLKLTERRMQDILNVNRFTICTWAGDVEATDIWSDGAADIARPLNQLANVRVSQKAENGTLLNFGMQFYDSTGIQDSFSPGGYEPGPFHFFPFPGNPNEKLKRIDIPEMKDVFEELNWYKSQIESAMAATAIEKGEGNDGAQTLGEIQLLAAKAAKRIASSSVFYDQYWEDIGQLFADLVSANPNLLSPL